MNFCAVPTAPGLFNPLEVLPTRLGLSVRTAENTNTGAPCVVAVSSTHLGPIHCASTNTNTSLPEDRQHHPSNSDKNPVPGTSRNNQPEEPGSSKDQSPFSRLVIFMLTYFNYFKNFFIYILCMSVNQFFNDYERNIGEINGNSYLHKINLH